MFVKQSMDLHNIGKCGTVDEMLLKFCGKCGFRQYLPSKPGRYSVKFWLLANCASYYCYNIIPYLGREGDKVAINLVEKLVKDLVAPIFVPEEISPAIGPLPVWLYLKSSFEKDWLMWEL